MAKYPKSLAGDLEAPGIEPGNAPRFRSRNRFRSGRRPDDTLAEMLRARVKAYRDCLLWVGTRDRDGYGRLDNV